MGNCSGKITLSDDIMIDFDVQLDEADLKYKQGDFSVASERLTKTNTELTKMYGQRGDFSKKTRRAVDQRLMRVGVILKHHDESNSIGS